MNSNWSGLVRSYLNGKYFFKEYLGDNGEEGTFLADSAGNQPVIVRLMRAENPNAEAWENGWSSMARLSHANLLGILAHGRYRIDGIEYAYVVSERPDENLGDVLNERTLTAEEARIVLESTLPALRHLHANGYIYADYRPANIVAVGERIKLTTDAIKKLPDSNDAARSAALAQIRQIGETVRAMLTPGGASDAGQLPQPFAGIVEACSRAGEDWSPTLDQLQHTVEGGKAPQPKPAAPAEPVIPKPDPPKPVVPKPAPAAIAPTPITSQPDRPAVSSRHWSRAVMPFAGIAALLLIFLFWTASRRDGKEGDSTVRARTGRAEYRAPEPVSPPTARPSPVPELKPATPAPAKVPGRDWAVVAAIYRDYDAAHRRAASLAKLWKRTTPAVYPPERDARRYMVVLASGLSREQAERLRAEAISAGMPSDSYVTKVAF